MTIKIMLKENYLTMIKNAAKGQNFMFRNFFIIQDGIEKDALEDGGLACSAFASSILYLQNPVLEFLKKLKWIESTHANTESTVKEDAKAARDSLHDDLKAVHDKIVNVRQTLVTALSTWGGGN